ncbi:hypothetical protein B0H12DRAFT_1271461, partial [Mycena haematopus]
SLKSLTTLPLQVTSPTQTLGFTGGQLSNITWMDDTNQPALANFGLAKVSIYTGNSIDQTSLQTISESTDVTNPLYISFTPDPSIGPDGDEYFIRFESLTNKDPTDATIPLLAFSHVFTMSGMTGTFDAQVLSEISGQSTAPIGGVASPSSPAASQPSANAVVTGASKPSTPSGSASKSASKSASAKPSTASGSSAAIPAFVAGRSLWVGIGMAVAAVVFL